MYGAFIEYGATPWQIFQQTDGHAEITVGGRCICNPDLPDHAQGGRVACCVREEDTNAAVVDWVWAELADGQWRCTLRIPAGGLYRIESVLMHPCGNFNYPTRGDSVKHVGVGDVFVIAGQSNAVGKALDAALDPPALGVHLLGLSGRWDLAAHPLHDSTDSLYPALLSARPGISPYLAFAKLLRRRLGYPIGLIQTARGSSDLSYWDRETGPVYRVMREQIARSNGIRAVLWYQGCNDADDPDRAARYGERFARLAADLRADLALPGLPFLTVQLNQYLETNAEASFSQVREAQRQAARLDPRVFIVPSHDLRVLDNVHNSAMSCLAIGERLARCALDRLYGLGTYRAGDLREAVLTGPRTVALRFDNILDQVQTAITDPALSPFAVEDERGFLPLTGYAERGDTVILTLGRDPAGALRAHNCYGSRPYPAIAKDAANGLPVLAFSDVPVRRN